ncbi:MAG: 16S rRNA (cytosine(1402)-N(4))-methyltransferase RsmH [Rhodospirillales bacterium]|nr:16S rRNA (cytosine(1402)-N(4))-methyltransferase RsmH [Rhodospirillales bacterium]MCW8862707.1 16S rRNA (cytosine(1402)-N(4))-methyltransferase RsmH [Rhodospirillales bacterium]MCW8952864.1 16S rRNA (cytosine(1402)-N(4))-methyltransferase RsmH [Rhodospirillales bacterium]MCW8970471.1 16S rRNA (cytosine(1402)-N(4))-methyltransferase RsmH [Rhodospirillales bacterium]MCW9002829.1 16S rRNA (cytosine(1402)-N(4))-methyltransferase RsmH [Rhodospirillales bacterium]
MRPAGHAPVLLAEVVAAIAPRDGAVYVDGTFGGGGYTQAFLAAADCTVWAIDRDPEAIVRAEKLAAQHAGRLHVLRGCFGDMKALLNGRGVARVDGVAFDIGVSSMQIDDPDRGFSFREDGPLDMRMGRDGTSAADMVNDLPEKELADLIYLYGEERASRAIARAIVATRAEKPFTRTLELASVVRSVVRPSRDGIDTATRTFQALRIAVNDEIGELRRGLLAAESVLAPGGRLAVVSFHSLEDREVKTYLKTRSGAAANPSRHMPETSRPRAPSFRLIKRKSIRPTDAEIAANPRARSAHLRVAERTEAPEWPEQEAA